MTVENEHTTKPYLNEVANYLLRHFLQKYIKKAEDIQKYHFDTVQFLIDACVIVNEHLVHLGCSKRLKWTGDFLCRGRSTVDRNTKKTT